MADPTCAQLRDAGAFELMGELFSDAPSSHAFLEDLGISPALLLPFASLPAASWWRTVCRTVAQGRFEGVTTRDLVEAAAALFPGQAQLRALCGPADAAAPLRVLCLMSAPVDEARLRLGTEARVIREAAARSNGRLTVTVHPATRVTDILLQLDAAPPRIVHFAGHGTDDGRLLFEDLDGMSAAVPVEALAPALALHAPLDCVVLNSCWSAAFAEGLLECAHTVVGTDGDLDDDAGLVFAEAFYNSLAHSPSVERACEAGRASLGLHGRTATVFCRTSRTGQTA